MPLPKPSGCAGCPRANVGKGYVPPHSPPGARVGLLGSGPSQDEFLDAAPFVGSVGRKLDYWLERAGLDRRMVAFDHVVRCWKPGEGNPGTPPPDAGAIAHCRTAHWETWLSSLPPDAILVPVGMPAAKATFGRSVKESIVGIRCQVESGGGTPRTVLPILTPQNITRGRWSDEPAQIEYLRQVKDILNGTQAAASSNFQSPAPIGGEYIPSPNLRDLHRFRDSLAVGGDGIAVDIETAGDHLRCIGLFGRDAGWYLSFPVRDVGGTQYWRPDELPHAAEWLWDILSDPGISKVFHNGQAFDVPVLERNGFVVEGYDFDTMLAAHVAFPGTPKGLEDLSKLYLRVGGWKSLVKEDAEGEGK